MNDEATNLVLEHLKRIQSRLGNIELDVSDVKTRLSAMEQHQGHILALLGSLGGRMDRFDERLARIERRLDLVDA